MPNGELGGGEGDVVIAISNSALADDIVTNICAGLAYGKTGELVITNESAVGDGVGKNRVWLTVDFGVCNCSDGDGLLADGEFT